MKPDLGIVSQSSDSPLERTILAAGQYVRPSQDLRPRIIEAAKEQGGQRRAIRNIGGGLLLMGLLCVIAAPTLNQRTERFEKSRSPSASELQDQAQTIATQAGVGANWGLSEAYAKLRQSQAERFPKLRTTQVK